PSTSKEPLPSSVMVVPTKPVWSDPALATGLELRVLIVTVAGALLAIPSFTISRATYVPKTSMTNVGCTAVGSERVAVLPGGRVVSAHRYVRVSPSTSEEALPSSVTTLPTKPLWSGPAFATGGVLSVEIVTVAG